MRRINFALKLDEERLAALLASNPQAAHEGKLLGLLMTCYGGACALDAFGSGMLQMCACANCMAVVCCA